MPGVASGAPRASRAAADLLRIPARAPVRWRNMAGFLIRGAMPVDASGDEVSKVAWARGGLWYIALVSEGVDSMYYAQMFCYGTDNNHVGITGIRGCLGVVFATANLYAVHIPPLDSQRDLAGAMAFVA